MSNERRKSSRKSVDRSRTVAGFELKISVAAFGAEAVVSGDGFEEGGFSGSVFSGEEGDAGVDRYLGQRGDGRDGEGVGGPVFDSFAQEDDLFEHGEGNSVPSA